MSKCGNCYYGVTTAPSRMFCSAQNCFCEEVFYCKDYEPIAKSTTNYDRLRAMSDEELAEYHAKMCGCPPNANGEYCLVEPWECDKCWLDWLRKEVTE